MVQYTYEKQLMLNSITPTPERLTGKQNRRQNKSIKLLIKVKLLLTNHSTYGIIQV